jgi:uncharacterized membrane protein YphA (DoxX/SURF4 family)
VSSPTADGENRRHGEPDRRGARPSLSSARPWAATAARLLLGGVFLVAGALRLPDPAAAVRAVRAYQLLPEPVVAPVAFGLPVLEIAVGLALLAGVFVRATALASAVLLAVFIAGISAAWARGLQIDCGCFGDGGPVAAGQTAYGSEIARDAGLLLLAVALARWPRSRLALGRAASEPPTTGPTTPTDRTEEELSRAR